jgi:S-adenosylmethionine:tRNA ribosyltransferase-isomerase
MSGDPLHKPALGWRTTDFDYALPESLIAQTPASQRDQSRLLVWQRATQHLDHLHFHDLPSLLKPGDVLVYNDARVIPARLFGLKDTTGARLELLLLEENRTNDWWVMLRPGKRAPHQTRIRLLDSDGNSTHIYVNVVDKSRDGYYRVIFDLPGNILEQLTSLGHVPLPPYIERHAPSSQEQDRERYQTIYARVPGSVAAPTAGLHFTPQLLQALREGGISLYPVTLHVGAGTFAPVKAERVADHQMHEERFDLPAATAEAIQTARDEHRRIIAVGTTTVRVLESVARDHGGRLVPGAGRTRIFIYPACRFQIVEGLITNFHLPQSTLLMLVCAFASPGDQKGRERILGVYAEAVKRGYRFFSYGDAMLLI